MSQNKQILDYLEEGNSLTPLEALHKFGCLRCAARIKNLRDSGHKIKTVIVHHGKKRFASYVKE